MESPPTPSGRRKACLLYVVTYSISCLTKHSGNFWVLLSGRALGGISTSLLFSTFEVWHDLATAWVSVSTRDPVLLQSWLVAEHMSRGFPPALLGDVFSKSVFLGGGLMAILSGLVGNLLVEGAGMGERRVDSFPGACLLSALERMRVCLLTPSPHPPSLAAATAPFDAAITVMLLGGAIVAATWTENYGGEGLQSLGQQFLGAWHAITSGEARAPLPQLPEAHRSLETEAHGSARTNACMLKPAKASDSDREASPLWPPARSQGHVVGSPAGHV